MKNFLLITLLFISLCPLWAQNIGIGTASPSNKAILDIQSNSKGLLVPRMSSVERNSIFPSISDSGLLVFQTNTPTGYYFWTGSGWQYFSNILDGANVGETLFWNGTNWNPTNHIFDNNGSIGIGTTTPTSSLHINSPSAFVRRIHITNSTSGTSLLDGLTIALGGTPADAVIMQNEAQPLIFGTSGNERVRIDAAGNVGINNFVPAAKLDVSGTIKLGNNGTVINAFIKNTQNVDLPSIAAGTSFLQIFAVTNVTLGAAVHISPDQALSNGLVICYARVSSANNIEVKFLNNSAAAIDPTAMNWHIGIVQ